MAGQENLTGFFVFSNLQKIICIILRNLNLKQLIIYMLLKGFLVSVNK